MYLLLSTIAITQFNVSSALFMKKYVMMSSIQSFIARY